jgi:hypothetical protein
VGPSGWIGVHLDARTDWAELAELLEDAWRMSVPKKLLAQLAMAPTSSRPVKQAATKSRARAKRASKRAR